MPSSYLVLILYCAVTVGLAWLLAGYMHRVFSGRRVWPSPLIGPLERACLAAAGPAAARPQGWAAYGNMYAALLLMALLHVVFAEGLEDP